MESSHIDRILHSCKYAASERATARGNWEGVLSHSISFQIMVLPFKLSILEKKLFLVFA